MLISMSSNVAHALVRAASRLVSTLACNLNEFRGKRLSISNKSTRGQQQRGIRHDASATESLPPFLNCAFQFSRPVICMTTNNVTIAPMVTASPVNPLKKNA